MILPILRPAVATAMVYAFVRAITSVSAVIFLVSGEYNLATVYIVGRAEFGEYGLAIVYSAVLIVIMVVALLAIQALVGRAPDRPPRAAAPATPDGRPHRAVHAGDAAPPADGRVPRRQQALRPGRPPSTTSASRIERGTLVTLLGPSGCGKTSTLRLIAGLEQPSAGRILIGGEDVTHAVRRRARRQHGVPVLRAVPAHDGAGERLLRPARLRHQARARPRRRRRRSWRWSGSPGFERRLPSELSGGQQQRVAVARAIVLEPKVLLFDEPLSNLDAKLRRQRARGHPRAAAALGLTVVYVTHDQEEALAVSDRIIVMHSGRIVQDGTPARSLRAPGQPLRRRLHRQRQPAAGDARAATATTLASVAFGPLTLHLPHRGLPPAAAGSPSGRRRIRMAAPETASAWRIAGRVRKAAYLGSHMEYEVALDGCPGDVSSSTPTSQRRSRPGTPVARPHRIPAAPPWSRRSGQAENA